MLLQEVQLATGEGGSVFIQKHNLHYNERPPRFHAEERCLHLVGLNQVDGKIPLSCVLKDGLGGQLLDGFILCNVHAHGIEKGNRDLGKRILHGLRPGLIHHVTGQQQIRLGQCEF